MRHTTLLALAVLLLPSALAAQGETGEARARLARADAAWERGDTAAARAGYEAVLSLDPESSRATFQLARLLPPGSPRAVALLRGYTRMEPQDAWGWGALAEALVDAGEREDALEAYERALRLEPGAQEFARARARLLGRPRGAHAPAAEPVVRVSRDSDGNTALGVGVRADAAVTEALRLGVSGARVESGDGLAASSAAEAALLLGWRPPGALAVDAEAGAARTEGSGLGFAPRVVPTLRARARWSPPTGPAAELRLRREPVIATPLLLGQPIVLSEVRGRADLPLVGALRARGVGRAGTLSADGERNVRSGFGGGPVLRLGPTAEVSALYQQTRYADPSAAGYFAPARIEALDVGSYVEYYGAWPLTLALDVGGGVERVTSHDGVVGGWERALHLWSLLSWSLRPGRELRLEVEGYDTRVGEVLTPVEGGWRWGSAALSLRWALR